jgi:hypothetical protein
MKPDLKLIRKEPALDDGKSRKRLIALRRQLLAAAVRHVLEGKEGSQNDRLREASNISGIPLTLIDTALKGA